MILVTGATGNVGHSLVRTLLARGEQVRAATRDRRHAALPPEVEVVEADLIAPDTVVPALEGIEDLFLLGTFSTTAEILRHARAAGVRRVVLLTSRCVIGGHPDNAITAMWLAAEAAVTALGLRWTIVRPSGFH